MVINKCSVVGQFFHHYISMDIYSIIHAPKNEDPLIECIFSSMSVLLDIILFSKFNPNSGISFFFIEHIVINKCYSACKD